MKVKDVLLADVAKRSAVSVVTVNFLLNRDDDGDGNENGKKATGLDWQNNTCIKLFCTFFLPSLQDYNVKAPTKTKTFSFFS